MEVDRSRRLGDIELSENAIAVLKKRYLKKSEAGEAIEEPIEMFERVASNIAEGEFRFKEGEEAEALYEESKEKFLQMMLSRKFMPNSPTLMNAGREMQQLSACFVLPVEDSIDGIYDTLKHQAIIHKSGGGTGFGFSRLRPKNDLVKSTMGVSSGPVSFMAIYDASTDKIKQGGTRRGANMGILRVDHPDIEEFITCKKENDQINNFNISVAITDEFMEAVKQDADFDLKNPRDGVVIKTIRARDLFRQIVEGAWLNGEPGVVFIDKIDGDNPTPQYPIESTNPCSEAHLPPYDSCNLGSINLERFFIPGDQVGEGSVDWDGLRETIHTTIRFLDNVIEMNKYPLPAIDEMSRGNRRIGLGVMGFADLLIKLGITYDSDNGLAFAEKVMKVVDDEAWEQSRTLAEERGVMPHFEGSRHEARGDRVRNATVTTIAPTGTISMIAGCSGGIEPLFAVAFMRRQADMEMPDVNPEFVKLAKERGFYSEDLMTKVAEHGSVRDIPEVPEDVRSTWVTSHDISSDWHVKMQAAFQKYTSMGISKTINLPNHATPKDVEDAYMQAFATGCKGIAVYRDGSRDAQVLSTGKTTQGEGVPEPEVRHVSLAEARNGRPRTLSGVTKKIQTGHGPLFVSMNDDEFGPRECFVVLGKSGGTAAAFSEGLGRMISLAMTHGAQPAEIVHQLRGIQDGHPAGVGPNAVLSVPDGVAKAMGEHYLVEEDPAEARELPIIGACPDCASGLTRQEGCVVCHSCGYSKCS
ncbi:vitamin B12-dependent ribonucleotide reductase [soil metagenome]